MQELEDRIEMIEGQMERFKTMFLNDYEVFKTHSREFNEAAIDRLIKERIDNPGLRLIQLVNDMVKDDKS